MVLFGGNMYYVWSCGWKVVEGRPKGRAMEGRVGGGNGVGGKGVCLAGRFYLRIGVSGGGGGEARGRGLLSVLLSVVSLDRSSFPLTLQLPVSVWCR